MPTLVTRSILRARILRYLAWPFLMVAKTTWVVVWFVLYPLRAVAWLIWGSVESTGFQVKAGGGGSLGGGGGIHQQHPLVASRGSVSSTNVGRAFDYFLGEYVTWTFSPNNNGIAHQGRAG
jgi:hypothetical protein